jgi:hypothetical protein
VALDPELTLDLVAEDLPAAERQAQSMGLALRRGTGERALDLYIPFTAPDGEAYLIRLRCDSYDELAPSFQFVNPDDPDEEGPQWWARIAGIGYPRGQHGEVVYCTPGIREYHQHSSHRQEQHSKARWKLARVVWLVWKYLYNSGAYVGRGGV